MTKKWVYALLFLSVGFNILIIGMFIGRKAGGPPHRGAPPRVEFSARNLSRALPEPARAQARDIIRAKQPQLRAAMKERLGLEQEIVTLVRADTVDMNALKAALDRYRELSRVLAETPAEVLLEILPNLSLEERQKVSAQMFKRRERVRRRLKESD